MRQRAPANRSLSRTVGVATEAVTSFGRSVLWGVLKYANLQKEWTLHKDMWRMTRGIDSATGLIHWPNCDGTIIGGVSPEEFVEVSKRCRHLVACSGRFFPSQLPVVTMDDDAIGAMGAAHLVECGLKSFGFYGPRWATDDTSVGRAEQPATRRARGFIRALAQRGCVVHCPSFKTPDFAEILTHSHFPDLIEWLRTLPMPIGIMSPDDYFAHDLAVACREAGIGVPDKVAIIGVNNDELQCELSSPPLSSIECNFARLGYLAGGLLKRLMNGEEIAAAERLTELPPIRVHQRMSTNILAIDQPDVADAVRYIREHACEPCSVKDVMRAIPVSRRTLERRFAELLGRSVYDEITRVRVETARELLLQPDVTLEKVVAKCGFSSTQNFIRFYHQATGVTPAAFRRENVRIARRSHSLEPVGRKDDVPRSTLLQISHKSVRHGRDLDARSS